MKKLLIVLLTSIFIAGCNSNDTEKNPTENKNSQSVENVEKEGEQANENKDKTNEKESKETEKNNSNENYSELTEDEAKEQLVDYIKKNDPGIKELINNYNILMEKKGDKYRANIFPSVATNEENSTALFASYKIDRVTGEVEKIEDGYENIVKKFKEINPAELNNLINKKEKIIVYFGRKTCPYCREFVPILNLIVSEQNQKIYYINTEFTEDNIELRNLRKNLEIELVPSLLKFSSDGTYEPFDFSNTKNDLKEFIKNN